nr:hypothetical protein [Tanacetum cinerariifolium]
MPELEDITYSGDEDDVGAEADFNNMETSITVSPIPTTRVHKDHPMTLIIGDLSLATQTRSMIRVAKDQGGLSQINNDDFRTCMFACFLSQEEPNRKEGIDYEEVFAPVARIEAIRLFLAYASFMGFMVYQMDVKSAFLYRTIEEQRGKIDQTLFIKRQKDDIIFGSTNKDLHKAFEKLMKDMFQMSLIGELTFFLGLQVKKKKDGIFISQDKYVAEILRKFGLTDGKSASTPIDTEKPLLKDSDGVNTPRCDEDRLELIELVVFLLPSNEKVRIETSVAEKKVNDVIRLQALVDKKKVIITEATIRDALCLDDAEGIDCLPNEEIFTELARMGYEKPSTKLTFYKAFFSSQWKFLIHTILQCMSAKRTSWNKFSSSMASAVICLSTGDLSSHTIMYSSPALIQKVFANIRRVGKGCSGVETPLFEGMLVEQQVGEGADEVHVEDVSTVGVAAEGAASVADDEGRMIADIDADKDVTLKDVVAKDFKMLRLKKDVNIEPAELQEVVEVVTTAKLLTKVVTAASATITDAAPQLTTAAALTLTTAPSADRRRNGVVTRDPKESATPSTIFHSEAKS